MLDAGISGNADFGIFSASVAGRYVRNSTENRYRTAFHYAQTATIDETYKVPGFGDKALSQDAKDALNYGNDVFTDYCGDSFVTNAQVGAVLMVSVDINFASAWQKQEFDAEAKGSILGIGSVAGHFKSADSKLTKGASLSVNVIQLGGNTAKLANVLGQPGPDGYYMVSCGTGNIDKCNKMVTEIIRYTQTDFQNSINFDDPKAHLYVFDTNQKPYSKIGVRASLPNLTLDEQDAHNYLVTQIKQDSDVLNYFKSYRQQPFYLTSVVSDKLRGDLEHAIVEYEDLNKQYFKFNVLDACYGSLNDINTKCVYTANMIKKMHDKLSDSTKNIANSITSIYQVENPTGHEFKLIPISQADLNSGTFAVGYFTVFDPQSDQYIPTSFCGVDGSPDNTFTHVDPNITGRYMYCYRSLYGFNNLYIKRINKPQNGDVLSGIAGYYSNGSPVDFAHGTMDANSYMTYDNAKDFRYSPI